MEVARIPVLVKLTPNITNIVNPARAAVAAGANALSLINTFNSIIGVDLDSLEISPSIGGKGGHGGYAGPAVKPIALNMVAALGNDEVVRGASDFGDGRNYNVEGRGGVPSAGSWEPASLHRGDALWLPHH
jgi:dihydropyrimidine dehydrogenase (NAD+) subunit PreA